MDPTLITHHTGDYLWGSFYQEGADGSFETSDPATGVSLDVIPWRVAAIDTAVADARSTASAWGQRPLSERVGIAREFRDLLSARRGDLAAMVSREMGKPLWEATLECVATLRAIDLLIDAAESVIADEPHPSGTGMLRRRPLGVVGVITPYPYPVYGPVQTLLPVLLGGNTAVWKPSSLVPLLSQKLVECFDAARIPPGVLSMVQGPRDPVGQALVAHEGVDLIVGSGSAATGDAITEACASDRAPWLQTGGKGWAIVCADADLDRAAYDVVTGAFLTAGQRANATSRLLVERSVARPLLQRVVALAATLSVGAPSSDESFCGPLVDTRRKRGFDSDLRRYARAGIEFPLEGGSGQLETHLRRRGQCYVSPAIALIDGGIVPPKVPLPEEVEGPFLLAALVDDAEAAAELYNAHPYGLAAAVFTESQVRFEQLAAMLKAGAVNWNRGTIVASARYPNAGLDRSGGGAEANEGLLRACTWPQSTLSAAGRFDPSHRVPGMGWPEVMGVVDPSSLQTPPYQPDSSDDADVGPVDLVRSRS
ncbi:MAG: aldehyde dehydrogenase [Proteobacteria bacterium]|nr:aldehyde dehydrogenase [Pseudomonadota bacterium]